MDKFRSILINFVEWLEEKKRHKICTDYSLTPIIN
uniref:Uncharacterized protein n=1 Tax=Lepeophtheirus salmonis TaxID=72036 RepID=A0A0K2V3S7_LEPSM